MKRKKKRDQGKIIADKIFSAKAKNQKIRKEKQQYNMFKFATEVEPQIFNNYFQAISNHHLYNYTFPVNPKTINFTYYCTLESGTSSQFIFKNFEYRAEAIRDIVKIKTLYENAYLTADYPSAVECLDELMKKYGNSIWVILEYLKCYYHLYQSDEFEKRRDEVLSLCNNVILRNFAYYTIVKLESKTIDVLYGRIIDLLNDFRAANQGWIANIFSLYLLPLEMDKMRADDCPVGFPNLSIVDQYYILIQAITDMISVGKKTKNILVEQIGSLNELVNDEALNNIGLYLKNENQNNDLYILDILKKYYAGNYGYCFNKIVDQLRKNPSSTIFFKLLVKSAIFEGIDSLPEDFEKSDLNIVFELLLKIVRVDDNCSESIQMLECILAKNYPQKWTAGVAVLLHGLFADYNSERIASTCIGVKLSGIPYSSLLINLADTNFIVECKRELHESFEYDGLEVVPDTIVRYKIKYLISEKNIDHQRVQALFKLLKTRRSLIEYSNIRLEIRYYKIIGDYVSIIKTISERCICNPEEFRCYPIPEVLNFIENNGIDDFYRYIDLPILYHIYTQYISSDKTDLLNDSYEMYTELQGSHKPSNAYKNKHNLSKKDVYYLKNICTRNTMDICPFFESNDELNAERIAILNLLIERNHPESEALNKAINRIINETIIDKSKNSINSCKIYVDIDTLVAKKYKSYKSLFDIYRAFPLEDEHEDEGFYYLNNDETNISVTKGNRTRTLFRIFRQMSDDFVANPEYGLDKYLSTDIRHQTFLNLMRAGVSKHHLVTDRMDDGSYKSNDFWRNQFGFKNPELFEVVDDLLCEFSKRFDEKIIVVNDWLKVTFDRENKHNLFNFSVDTDEFDSLKYAADCAEEFDDFFDVLILLMWKKTNKCLDALKIKLNEDFRSDIDNLFDELKNKISPSKKNIRSKLKFKSELEALCLSISMARNEIIGDIGTVTSWLGKREQGYSGGLDISTLLEVGQESFQAIKHDAKIEFIVSGDDLSSIEITPKEARAIIRSLIMAFENAVKHGSHQTHPKIDIITVKDDNAIEIIISNYFDVKQFKNVDTLFFNINKLLSDEEQVNLVRKESGTGLYKIAHLLNRASERFEVSVFFEKPKSFRVKIRGAYEDFNYRRRQP